MAPIRRGLYVREMRVRYVRVGRVDLSERIQSPAQIASAVRLHIADDPREHLIACHLDSRHRRITLETLAIGTLNQSLVHPREVFRSAVRLDCSALVLAHTHPSGDPKPSGDDREVTERLAGAGKLLGIELLDHVVVCPDAYYSYAEADPDVIKRAQRRVR